MTDHNLLGIFAREADFYQDVGESGEVPEAYFCPTFSALSQIVGFQAAQEVLDAIEAGAIPELKREKPSPAVALLNEVQGRMAASAEKARAAHAAWNPAEVITRLCLEIETGKYEVKL